MYMYLRMMLGIFLNDINNNHYQINDRGSLSIICCYNNYVFYCIVVILSIVM